MTLSIKKVFRLFNEKKRLKTRKRKFKLVMDRDDNAVVEQLTLDPKNKK